jgi:hypothetical protein
MHRKSLQQKADSMWEQGLLFKVSGSLWDFRTYSSCWCDDQP